MHARGDAPHRREPLQLRGRRRCSATAGVPVVVSATAHTSGVNNDHAHDDDTVNKLLQSKIQPGAVIKTSECVLQLPEDGGQFACTLF